MMSKKAEIKWTKSVLKNKMAYPSEYVIRIFRGEYPRLNLKKDSFKNKSICEAGCGDGRHLGLLKLCGFDVFGVEINEEIVNKVKSNIQNLSIEADIRAGTNANIPFADDRFDYLLSWNACYYLGEQLNFDKNVEEFARVTKPEGYLVLSIPQKTCFIYHGSENWKDGYQIIRNDPFNIRNGEILRIFENEDEIQKTFSKYFKDFIFGSIHDDCFGFDYHWHLVICQRK